MRKYLFILFLLYVASGEAKEIAITIDDLPLAYASKMSEAEQEKIFKKTLATLDKYQVKVMGFAVGSSIRPHHEPLLKSFVESEHVLGNHTNEHPDYNKTSIFEYKTNIRKGQEAIRHWAGPKKYFRFPMLRRGDTLVKREVIHQFLVVKNYTTVPVTIDNDEWEFNKEYVEAIYKNENKKKGKEIAVNYLKHMKEKTRYFQSLAKEKLGREPIHILLIHMNLLNANHLEDLLKWYQKDGWKFVSVEEALEDSVYQLRDEYVGLRGLSWIQRISPVGPLG